MRSHCAVCGLRRRAERKPNSLIVKIWRWHTRWCPGWRAYQRELAEQSLEVDYAAVRDAEALEPVRSFGPPVRALVAARLGDVRLIDNMRMESD